MILVALLHLTCCPADALRSAFLSLQREAPRHLLSHQLMSGAAHPGSWWTSQQAFTASAAVGSMLGWLLGLGDRHLDNLLLDTDTGELLHIDFSVCFDKGATLAVPEVVPFRLTQMLQVGSRQVCELPTLSDIATVLGRLIGSETCLLLLQLGMTCHIDRKVCDCISFGIITPKTLWFKSTE